LGALADPLSHAACVRPDPTRLTLVRTGMAVDAVEGVAEVVG